MANARTIFTDAEKQQIVNAIHDAELITSGEIKLHIEEKCDDDVLKRAIEIFHHLNMHKTNLRNGVLIYIAVKDKKFSIIADEGIHNKVPENFWEKIKERMQDEFSRGNFLAGILYAIEQSAQQLKKYFPLLQNDNNELDDEISFGE